MELKNIQLPNNLKKIDERTFASCHSMETIEIPRTIEGIGKDAFARCSLLKSMKIPTTIKNIETISIEEKKYYSYIILSYDSFFGTINII